MTSSRAARVGALGVGVALALGLALAGCSSGDPFEPLPVPGGASAPITSTTVAPDFSGVALAPVEGTLPTAEVVVGPGPSTLAGRVDGPDGPVEGAVVRLERLVGDASASLDVTTGPDGAWQASDVLGGRYRARAWRTPDLALLEPQILFVEAGRTAEVGLVLERFRASAVDTAIAPDPPRVGQRVNLLVRVSSQVVDDDGVVRATPEPGVALTLAPGTGWEAVSPVRASTDAGGGVTFILVCRFPGSHPLMLTLPPQVPPSSPPGSQPSDPPTTSPATPEPPPTPEVLNLGTPACVAPPPPTVPSTVPPPVTGPGGTGPTTTADS